MSTKMKITIWRTMSLLRTMVFKIKIEKTVRESNKYRRFFSRFFFIEKTHTQSLYRKYPTRSSAKSMISNQPTKS